MANADFEPRRSDAPGGFEAGSYRAKQKPQQQAAPRLTPAQQGLTRLEGTLPGALRTRAAAAALALVLMAGSTVGFAGAKLRAKYAEAQRWYTQGVEMDNGYCLYNELNSRVNSASNVITTAQNTEGLGPEHEAVQQAQAAVQQVAQMMGQPEDMHELYLADQLMGSAVDRLYGELQALAADPMDMGPVQSQYAAFHSSGTVTRHLAYNDAVEKYNKETGGFPAEAVKSLLGIQEVKRFG